MRCICCCALQTLRECHAEQHYLGAIASERILVEPVTSPLDLTQGKPGGRTPRVKPSSVPEWAIIHYAVIESCMLKSTMQCRDGCLGAVLSGGNVSWKYKLLSCSSSGCHVIAAQLSYFNNQVSDAAMSLKVALSQQASRPQNQCIACQSSSPADMILNVVLNVSAGDLSASGDGSNDIAPEVLAAWQAGMTPAQASTAAGDVWSLGSLLYFIATGRKPFSAKGSSRQAPAPSSSYFLARHDEEEELIPAILRTPAHSSPSREEEDRLPVAAVSILACSSGRAADEEEQGRLHECLLRSVSPALAALICALLIQTLLSGLQHVRL